MFEMFARDFGQRLGAEGEKSRLPFSLFRVRPMQTAAKHGRGIRVARRSRTV